MQIKHWLLAIRPKTLPAAVCPVLVGAACAASDNAFSFVMFVAALSGALLLQISVNLANDYFDFKNKIDTHERKGPVRVTQSGLIKPETVRNATIFTLLLSLILGLFLIMKGGVVILVIVIASLICAVCYSGGPYPIASNGLGEVFVFLFFGPVAVCGTYYLMAGMGSWECMAVSIPVGLLITAIIVVNNLRDIQTDAKAGKRTLPVILGYARTKTEYFILVLLSFLLPCLMFASGWYRAAILLPLLVFHLSFPLLRAISEEKGEALNLCLAGTAKMALAYCALFSCGILFS
ncbi:1,4-dihydroxy-2-naphthoate polyprenyltransferase [Desulfobacula sp.]|uniref:1,4-dihydroxy-2-naphthoate polyprenyltransferase n=1 Tax=Desulfobacula sp. TaxID=2593537 RepID=UPI002609D56F|nr:1,4-dihydroxy-2-naphthoate polyprenyltransferase [Desulfobacula sp.]